MLIQSEYDQGIRNIIFTPHFRKGMFEINSKERLEVYRKTALELKSKFPNMNFLYGCELFIDSKSLMNIEDTLNLIHGKKLLLAEFRYTVEYEKILSHVKYIMSRGIKVIIAHVERYDVLRKDITKVVELRKMGCFIQVNADSVIGKAGLGAKYNSNKMIKNNLVDFIASDAHDVDHRDVRMKKAMDYVSKKYGAEVVELLFRKNAEALFGIGIGG